MQRFGTAVWLLLLDFAGGVAAGLVAFATRIPKDALDMITEHPALGYALIGVGGVLISSAAPTATLAKSYAGSLGVPAGGSVNKNLSHMKREVALFRAKLLSDIRQRCWAIASELVQQQADFLSDEFERRLNQNARECLNLPKHCDRYGELSAKVKRYLDPLLRNPPKSINDTSREKLSALAAVLIHEEIFAPLEATMQVDSRRDSRASSLEQ